MLPTSSQQLKDVTWLSELKTPITVCQSKQNLVTLYREIPSVHSFEDLSQVCWFGLAQLRPSEASFQRWSPAHLCWYTETDMQGWPAEMLNHLFRFYSSSD